MAIRDFYSDIDLKGNQLFNSRVHNVTTAQRAILALALSVSDAGYQVYDTDLLTPYYWNGTAWNSAVTLSPSALTKTDDTNVTLTLTGTPSTALLQNVDLALGWTGTLAVSRGGTGLNTLGVAGQLLKVNSGATGLEYFTPPYLTTAVTSVGLSVPPAFTVSGSPVTGSGTLSFYVNGNPSQYIRGDGVLADFPTNVGGGSVVNYYLNGSIFQQNIGGDDYYQMSKTPVIGGGTNFPISTNGYIGYFITDALDPSLLSIPAGSWNFKIYMNADSAGGTPSFYLELYKYNTIGGFTFIADNSANPEMITGGTSVDLYYTSVAVPQTPLTTSDRLAVRIYVNNSGKTITLHTENNTLAQVGTTFSTGITALNGSISQVQYFQTGTAGTDFNIDSLSTPGTHIFDLPTASATNTGKLSNTDYTTFTNKASKGFAVAMAAAL